MTDLNKYRPPIGERWTDGMQTDCIRIEVRTKWLYSEYDPKVLVPEGRTRHAFARGGEVTCSDVPTKYEHVQSLNDHISRAVAAFGDDKDLVIEVRLAGHADESRPLPVGLCADKEDHQPHEHLSASLGAFWCSADQDTRLPWAAERRQAEAENKGERPHD